MQRPRFGSEQIVRFAEPAPAALSQSTLSTRESLLVDLLRKRAAGGMRATEVLRHSPLEDHETLETLSRLITMGVLELEDGATGADATDAGVPPGATLPGRIGRFEVDGFLGRGSMGSVLLARDPAIDRVVAIKLIQTATHLSPSQRDRYRDRFYREASAAGQLHHPRIATVFDVGHDEAGTPFIVMEYVKGQTLRDLLDERRLTLEQSLRIASDVLEGLGYAHSQGIVHRDVKPDNIIIGPDYHAKITDFGIAHVLGSELTSGNDVHGSPSYMAPEQLSKGTIDARTDLFSFAIVLYRMLTGELPFAGDSFAAIAHSILHERPRSVARLAPSVPPAIDEAVSRALRKDPADRFASAAEFRRALGVGGAGAVPAAIGRRVANDRWLPVALALVVGAFLVFRLATRAPAPPVSEPVLEAPSPTVSAQPAPPKASEPPANAHASGPPSPPKEAEPPPRAPDPQSSEPGSGAQVVPEPGAPFESSRASISHDEDPATLSPPPPLDAAAEAELFYEAGRALERGELQASRAALERLLELDPSFTGAAELLVEVSDQIWQRELPLDFQARHNHRLGGCEGELSLAALGVRFTSSSHEWAWSFEDVRVMERVDELTVVVETFETDPLLFGKNKRYKFELDRALARTDWERYQRLWK